MKALIVLDCQKGMLERGNFDELRKNILTLQNIFKQNGDIIINTRHIDDDENSIIYNVLFVVRHIEFLKKNNLLAIF